MIKTQKQQLSNFKLLAFITFLFLLQVYYGIRLNVRFLGVSIIFYFLTALIIVYLFSKGKDQEESIRIRLQDLEEKVNTTGERLHLENIKKDSLHFKLKKYNSLNTLIEKLNKNLSLLDTAVTLIDEIYGVIGLKDKICLLYLYDSSSQALSMLARRPHDIENIIREKNGDVYDQWVLRQATPLLVTDTRSDFRFDLSQLHGSGSRQIGSLIASPLLSLQRVMGIIRVESRESNGFSLEDLRLLNTISDIASVAIDNALYYQRTNELAIKDNLTGLYLRKYTLERLEEELKRSFLKEEHCSVLMIDIDFFKKYNDQYGHLAGDIVLKELGGWLMQFVADFDSIIGRYGGEEFLVILPSLDKKEAFTLAEKICSGVQNIKIELRRKVTAITISVGLATFPQDAKDTVDLIQKADSALYSAKRTGRNRVSIS